MVYSGTKSGFIKGEKANGILDNLFEAKILVLGELTITHFASVVLWN